MTHSLLIYLHYRNLELVHDRKMELTMVQNSYRIHSQKIACSLHLGPRCVFSGLMKNQKARISVWLWISCRLSKFQRTFGSSQEWSGLRRMVACSGVISSVFLYRLGINFCPWGERGQRAWSFPNRVHSNIWPDWDALVRSNCIHCQLTLWLFHFLTFLLKFNRRYLTPSFKEFGSLVMPLYKRTYDLQGRKSIFSAAEAGYGTTPVPDARKVHFCCRIHALSDGTRSCRVLKRYKISNH